MTLTQLGIMLATFAALGAAIKAGPSVWAFVRNVARIPSMTESIWKEFGRGNGDGDVTTRDRIEHIARQVDRAEATANNSIEIAKDTKETMSVHLMADATSFSMVAQSNERVATRLGLMDERLGRLEEAVAKGTKQEKDHADAAASAAERNGRNG